MIKTINNIINDILTRNGIQELKISKSNRPDLCDFQCNEVFKLAKSLGMAPMDIGNKIVKIINEYPDFNLYFKEVAFVMPGFINITVSDRVINEEIRKMENPLFNITPSNENYVIDYGGPNIAKPLHVGHLRSAIIGESVKRILKYKGNKVISDVHLGDYGLQIGEVIYAIKRDGLKKEDITLEYLNKAYPEMSALCKVDEDIKKECEQITKDMQDGNPEYNELCDVISKVSITDIKKIYDSLDVSFDLWESERTAYKYIPELEELLNKKGILYKSEGAMVIDVKDESDTKEIPPMIFQKSNGAYLYGTTDMATIYDRENKFSPDKILYVTDDRQAMHFKQVFRASTKAGITDALLEHLPYGTVNGTDGKPYKTRKGDAPSLSDMLEETKEGFISKKEENKNMSDEDLNKITNAIVKFADLSNDRTSDYIFDIDKFSSVVGKTGPYILYTYLRFNKILTEEGKSTILSDVIYNKTDRDLRMSILELNNSFEFAYSQRKPSFIAEYLYNLCVSLNNFYQTNHIKTADDNMKNDWLYIIELATKIIKEMLSLLAISIPSKM